MEPFSQLGEISLQKRKKSDLEEKQSDDSNKPAIHSKPGNFTSANYSHEPSNTSVPHKKRNKRPQGCGKKHISIKMFELIEA